MNTSSLRFIASIALHELRSLAVNPSMAATAVFLLIFSWMFTDFFHFFESFSAPFLCQLGACSIGGIGIVCVLAEENERGSFETLSLANVSRTDITLGKTIACIVASELICFICSLIIMHSALVALEIALLLLFTTIPVSLVSVAIGLHLNDQQCASSWGSPILFIGVITAAMEVVIDVSPWVLPTGAAPELIDTLIFGNAAAVSPSITAVIGLVYCVIAAVALVLSVRKK